MSDLRFRFRPACEQMEGRDVPSATFENGVLTITPEAGYRPGANVARINFQYRDYGPAQVNGRVLLNDRVILDTRGQYVNAENVKAIVVKGTNEKDVIDLSGVNGGDPRAHETRNRFTSALNGHIKVWGYGGDDDIRGSEFDDKIDGGAGNNLINCGGGNDTVYGWPPSLPYKPGSTEHCVGGPLV